MNETEKAPEDRRELAIKRFGSEAAADELMAIEAMQKEFHAKWKSEPPTTKTRTPEERRKLYIRHFNSEQAADALLAIEAMQQDFRAKWKPKFPSTKSRPSPPKPEHRLSGGGVSGGATAMLARHGRRFVSVARNVDWDMWRDMPTAELWEAVALSLGNSPVPISNGSASYYDADYSKRLRIAKEHQSARPGSALQLVGGPMGTNHAKVSLSAFRAWALSLGWTLPMEFPRSATDAGPASADKAKLDQWRKEDLWSEADLQALCCGLEPNAGRAATVPLNEAAEKIRRAVLAKALPVASAPVDATDGDHMYGHSRFFDPATATQWAAERFQAFPFTIGDFEPQDRLAVKAAWPWGDHQTKLLGHLAEAARRWWVNVDAADNTTAPTNQQVSDWLKKRGVGKAMADKMATILRADELPAGPRT